MTWIEDTATKALLDWQRRGLERHPATFSSPQTPRAIVDGEPRILFSSSNYLGLAERSEVIGAARQAIRTFGAGSGGSRLATGTSTAHELVESTLAAFLDYPDAILFGSGFAANTGVLQALAEPGVRIFSDASNHASLIDGCRLAKTHGAEVTVFPHGDLAALQAMLVEASGQRCLVVTDGVFSMDGTLAPLPELTELCRRFGAALMVDDAHGLGTVGATGRGIVEHFGMQQDPPDVLVVTGSKALGAEGGAVLASESVIAMLRQRARPYVYSTAPSPAVCAALTAALDILNGPNSPVPDLHRNVSRMATRLGLNSWPTPIIPVAVGDETASVQAAHELGEQGWFVPAMRWPTVPRSRAILRVTVMATHTDDQIDGLADALARLGLPHT